MTIIIPARPALSTIQDDTEWTLLNNVPAVLDHTNDWGVLAVVETEPDVCFRSVCRTYGCRNEATTR